MTFGELFAVTRFAFTLWGWGAEARRAYMKPPRPNWTKELDYAELVAWVLENRPALVSDPAAAELLLMQPVFEAIRLGKLAVLGDNMASGSTEEVPRELIDLSKLETHGEQAERPRIVGFNGVSYRNLKFSENQLRWLWPEAQPPRLRPALRRFVKFWSP